MDFKKNPERPWFNASIAVFSPSCPVRMTNTMPEIVQNLEESRIQDVVFWN